MLTTEGAMLCATTTTGVLRAAVTVFGIGAAVTAASRGLDSAAGLQPAIRIMRTTTLRASNGTFFIPAFYGGQGGRGRGGRRGMYTTETDASVDDLQPGCWERTGQAIHPA